MVDGLRKHACGGFTGLAGCREEETKAGPLAFTVSLHISMEISFDIPIKTIRHSEVALTCTLRRNFKKRAFLIPRQCGAHVGRHDHDVQLGISSMASMESGSRLFCSPSNQGPAVGKRKGSSPPGQEADTAVHSPWVLPLVSFAGRAAAALALQSFSCQVP